MHTVIETPTFIRDAADAGVSEAELADMVAYIAAHPQAGDPIKGTGGARKVRFAGKGKGKSGAYRVVTFYSGKDVPVWLLAMIDKGDRANLSKAEQNELRKELAGLVMDYLQSVRDKVAKLKRVTR